MRAKSFRRVLIASILLASVAHFAVAAPPQHQTHLAKDHVAPLVALKEAVELLPASTAKTAVTAPEMELFGKIADGHADQVKLSEAVLTIAGVTDAPTMKRYLAKLDQITAEARLAIAKGATSDEKFFFLADYLRHGPLQGGVDDVQVDMRKLLDTGKFNCVSSAILYNLIGVRLGLNTKAVLVPEHVFLRAGDCFIEPEFGLTYTPANHQSVEDVQWKTAAGYWKDIFGTARHYESGNTGLLGQVYYDRDSHLFAKDRYDAAAILGLKAVCLDPNQPLFTYMLKLNLQGWFNDTLQHKNYAKAQKIAGIYGQLYGDSSSTMLQQVAAARNSRQVAKS